MLEWSAACSMIGSPSLPMPARLRYPTRLSHSANKAQRSFPVVDLDSFAGAALRCAALQYSSQASSVCSNFSHAATKLELRRWLHSALAMQRDRQLMDDRHSTFFWMN